MKTYSESIKEQMVRRLLTPPGISVLSLSEETGISTSALCKWRKARVKAADGGAKEWTASEKLRVLGGGTPPLEGEAFGALLRREGLHEAQVIAWRAAAAEALSAEAAPGGASNSAQRQELAEVKKRVKELEREALRKDKALAEAAALLLLEKKLQSIRWHSAAESTGTRSDEGFASWSTGPWRKVPVRRPCAFALAFPRGPCSVVDWYNTKHRHSAIRFVTPDQRHFGHETGLLAKRAALYELARRQKPNRWSRQTRNWSPAPAVHLGPVRLRTAPTLEVAPH